MKSYIKLLIPALFIFLYACSSSKKMVSYTEDKAVAETIKQLNKKPGDAILKADLQAAYDEAVKKHQDKIQVFQTSDDPGRWDNTIKELNALQNLYDAITSSAVATRIVKPQSYFSAIDAAKKKAAEEYYQHGLEYLDKGNREDIKEAYYSFRKTASYVPDYKDAAQKMKEAYEKGTVNVVVNPIQYDNLYFSGWNYSYNYRDEYYIESLVRDLGGRYNSRYPANFYTEREARSYNIAPDMLVDLTWRNLDFSSPYERRYSVNRSKQVQIGKDSSGKAVYQTVFATVYITRRQVEVRGDMEYRVVDNNNGGQLDWGRTPVNYQWDQEIGTYAGDSRALTEQDWYVIRRSAFTSPTREQLMDELMRKVNADLRSRIQRAVDW